MRALYSFNIFLYGISIRLAALFNTKAKLWVRGRKNLFTDLEKKINSSSGPIAWFHCASLGEFEQGRPLMEALRKQHPEFRILLTFFSPSGYEIRKNYSGADIISYLPLDTPGNARRFIATVNPAITYFIKYEFWLNLLAELRKKKLPHFLVSAIFRKDQVFFKSYGGIFRQALKGFSFLFTQENKSSALLESIGINNSLVTGDTRFDRVIEISSRAKKIELAELFATKNENLIVAGSTWPADEAFLFEIIGNKLQQNWKLIIAPHELGEMHLLEIENGFHRKGIPENKITRFSKANADNISSARVLIIDNIGMLSALYQYGDLAYIGGGFGKSIHNTLEAAVFGIPVVFGPRFEKFNEAKELISCGGGFGVRNGDELKLCLDNLLSKAELREKAGEIAGEYVKNHAGATAKILKKTIQLINH
ncbi:glycosyltransferase N-terminal domain-containing protein [soil metagenome]